MTCRGRAAPDRGTPPGTRTFGYRLSRRRADRRPARRLRGHSPADRSSRTFDGLYRLGSLQLHRLARFGRLTPTHAASRLRELCAGDPKLQPTPYAAEHRPDRRAPPTASADGVSPPHLHQKLRPTRPPRHAGTRQPFRIRNRPRSATATATTVPTVGAPVRRASTAAPRTTPTIPSARSATPPAKRRAEDGVARLGQTFAGHLRRYRQPPQCDPQQPDGNRYGRCPQPLRHPHRAVGRSRARPGRGGFHRAGEPRGHDPLRPGIGLSRK